MMILFLILLLVSNLVPTLSFATDRYVDIGAGCSAPVDTDYNHLTRSCGSGSELVYTTINGACTAHASNDNIYVRGGTYAEVINDCLKSGSGPNLTVVTNLQGWPGEWPVVRPNSYTGGFGCALHIGTGKHDIVVQGIDFNGAGCTGGGSPVSVRNTPAPTYIWIKGNKIRDSPTASGILMACSNCQVTDNEIYNNGTKAPATGGRFDHGIYFGGGFDTLIARNNIHENTGWGIQVFSQTDPNLARITTSHNFVHDNQKGADCPCGEIVDSADTDTIEFNIVKPTVTTSGLSVNLQYGAPTKRNSIVRHNSIYGGQIGLNFNSGSGHVGQNNIICGATTAIGNTAGATLTTNLTSCTPANVWADPTNGNLTLKAGSAAIDAGTNIGLPFNGSSPDQGCCESFTALQAVMSGTTLDITFGMNANTPPQNVTSTAPWTVGCTGAGCGTPAVSAVALAPGASSVLRLTVGGFTLAVGQTITVSYNAGAITDSLLVGASLNQSLFSFSGFAVTNQAGGGSPVNGTFSQVAHQFQKLYTLSDGTVEAWGANNADQVVNDGGSVAIEFQVNCENVSDCLATSFSLYYGTDGISYANAVPDTAGADGVHFPGLQIDSFLNTNLTNGALTGVLSHTNGPTQYTAAATPVIDLGQNTSLTLRYLISFVPGHIGQVYYFKLKEQTGNAFAGTYTPSTGAKVTIVPPQAGLG